MQVCSTEYVFHAFLNPQDGQIESVLKNGLRPLSDFPESDRWQQIQSAMPGFFENLYDNVARPVLQKPYLNSGIFVSPIDFQRLPDSLLYNKTRVRIPVARLDPEYAVLTYVINAERVSLSLTDENLIQTAQLWTNELITQWFAKDTTRLFYYVPQIAIYQPNGIPISMEDLETFS